MVMTASLESPLGLIGIKLLLLKRTGVLVFLVFLQSTVLFYSNGFGASFRMARRCGLPSSKLCLVSMELLGLQLSRRIGDPSGLISFKLSIRSKIKKNFRGCMLLKRANPLVWLINLGSLLFISLFAILQEGE
ncbi:hypothetical protein Tco_0249018 [Tanacetum coccineum]